MWSDHVQVEYNIPLSFPEMNFNEFNKNVKEFKEFNR